MHEYECGLGFIRCKAGGWFVYWITRTNDDEGQLVWQHSRPLFRIPWSN